MTNGTSEAWERVARQYRADAGGWLDPGETVLGWLELDLDREMRFGNSLLALTSKRLAHWRTDRDGGWSSDPEGMWELERGDKLTLFEEAGIITLRLTSAEGPRAEWRSTAAQKPSAVAFAGLLGGRPGAAPTGRLLSICPVCGAELPGAGAPCPVCASREPAAGNRSLLRLWQFARRRFRMIAFGFFLTLASTAAGLVPPYLTMPLMDEVLIPYQQGQEVPLQRLVWYLSALGGAALLAWGLAWTKTWVLSWVSERISSDLRQQTYGHLQRLGLEFFAGKRTGDLIARVGTDTDRICYFLSVHLIDFASDILMIALTAVILLSIDPVLALATLGPLPVIAWLVQRARESLRGGFAVGSRAWGELTSVLADTIPGIRVVKAFAQESREVQRFQAANEQVLQANDYVNRTWSFFGPMVVLLTELGLLVVWSAGAGGVFSGRITVGVLTAFLAYIARFYTRLESMSRMLAAFQRAAASTHRVFEILDHKPGVVDPPDPVCLPEMRGEVELQNVGFSYGEREVLNEVSLHIRPGEMVGLVGASGGGKTTLINLICRFYDVSSGAILVDGVDLRRLSLEAYRSHVGLVLQEPFLFYGTIAENIAYGRPEADRAEIIAAAEAARAHDFIVRLPDGYDSLVGERGQSLSGGERQRISIARALLVDPRILILDEATSSVDTETEREIQLALENLIQGRTSIAIAHRLSTVRRADRLVVLDRGRIVEEGSHAELLEAGGYYARLHAAQLELGQRQAI
ncbi:MAG TPA: ABC transporter ATP-binding protein [Verrucomicrobiales bacterium]|nr:ABC transporter ATP-binding protein [Verrucomicrobiales bacterium]